MLLMIEALALCVSRFKILSAHEQYSGALPICLASCRAASSYALKDCCHCSTKFKLVILDECDAMTKDAQFALRRGKIAGYMCACAEHGMPDLLMVHAVIEKYTRNARFCLICNYVSKIIPALQSRCTRFRFPPLGEDHVRDRLQHVIDSER